MSYKLQYRLVLQGTRAQLEQADVIFGEFLNSEQILAIDLGEGAGETWQLALYFLNKPEPDKILGQLAEFMSVEGVEASIEEIPDINWVAKVQSDLAPVRAGRFLVYGSHDKALAQSENFAIEINAGEAFGTAHHGTTLGCLETIDTLLKSFNPRHILDLGTGTGVLAIAVAMATHKKILATDIDPISVAITKANARINGMAGFVKAAEAKGFAAPIFNNRQKFDLIIANILAEPLMKLAYDVGQRTHSGGHVILSGILHKQARHVCATYQNQGFAFIGKIVKDKQREGWTTLHFLKK